jgi:hypothetical protein
VERIEAGIGSSGLGKSKTKSKGKKHRAHGKFQMVFEFVIGNLNFFSPAPSPQPLVGGIFGQAVGI